MTTKRFDEEPRQYTAGEVKRIISQAAKRQQRAGLATEQAEARLSLDEVQHLAAEAGIDPRHIRAAALEIERSRTRRARFGEAPREIVAEREVEGELTQAQRKAIARALRAHYEEEGRIEQQDETWVWSVPQPSLSRLYSAPPDRLSFSISTHEGVTRLRLTEAAPNLDGVLVLVGLVLAFIPSLVLYFGFGINLPLLADLVIMFIVLMATVLAGGLGVSAWAKRKQADLEVLMDRFEDLVAPPARSAAALPAEVPPLLDVSTAAPAPEDQHPARHRTRS